MFFRRKQPPPVTFEQRLETLRRSGFQVTPASGDAVRAARNGCAAVITEVPGDRPHIDRAGWAIGSDIALLVDGGYQKFWGVGKERKAPALASQLTALHEFEEDLREALGLVSLYNTSLGTTNDLHMYDRVEGRDTGVANRPWQVRGR